MASTVWRGQLTFGLVSFPVRLHIAARKERVRMHYLRRAASKGEPLNEQTPVREHIEEEAAEPDQQPNGRVQRELVEEAGVSARRWDSLESYLSSPGIFTEVLHLFLATGIEPAATAHEQAEVIEIHWVPFAEACEWAVSGRIRDGKTAMGLIRARHFRSSLGPTT